MSAMHTAYRPRRDPRDPPTLALCFAFVVAGTMFGPLRVDNRNLTDALGLGGKVVWSYALLIAAVAILTGAFLHELQLILGVQAFGGFTLAGVFSIYPIASLHVTGVRAVFVATICIGIAVHMLLLALISLYDANRARQQVER